MMRINGVMNNYPISYKAKMDKSNSVLFEKTSNVEVNNKDLEKQAINTLLFSVSKPLGILSMLNKRVNQNVKDDKNSQKPEDLKPILDVEGESDDVLPVVDMGLPVSDMDLLELPSQPVPVEKPVKITQGVDLSGCAEISEEVETLTPAGKRMEMIEDLKKEIDYLGAEEAINMNEYYEDCDCSVINTSIRANKDGFFVVVDLVDEKIRNDKELKEQIIQSLKLQQFREMSARLGLQKEPTPELLALEIVDLNAVNKELLSRATIYERAIGIPENAKILEKIFEPWYINYIKLCKQLGVSPRECGVKGGAFDHYLQLQQRQNADTYPDYVKTLQYRAGYDENAFHDYVNLAVDDKTISSELGNLLSNIASSEGEDFYSLRDIIDLIKKVPQYQERFFKLLQALQKKEINIFQFKSELGEIRELIKFKEKYPLKEVVEEIEENEWHYTPVKEENNYCVPQEFVFV